MSTRERANRRFGLMLVADPDYMFWPYTHTHAISYLYYVGAEGEEPVWKADREVEPAQSPLRKII